MGDFKQFVAEEKKRLQPKRATAIWKAKDERLADLLKFSKDFKVRSTFHTEALRLNIECSCEPQCLRIWCPY